MKFANLMRSLFSNNLAMQIEIEVNGQILKTRKGDILLSVLNQNGIRVPTLCSMEGFPPTGACRLCIVEVEGMADLVPACSYPVEEWMKVNTHSARVIQARRTIVELLISNHPDECLYCFQNKHCELQKLATELNVMERKGRTRQFTRKIDRSSPSIIHDASKCVLCGRCIRICDHQRVSALEFISRGTEMRVGTVGDKGLSSSDCISCGQCIRVCPTGSLQEKGHLDELISHLHQKQQQVIALVDPAVMVSIGDELGFRSGKDVSGLLFSALRKIGFDQVHSGSESVDITMFQAARLWKHTATKGPGPSLISFCPSWMQYIENLRPDLMSCVLPVLSPAQTFGRLIKDINTNSYIVYFSPCVGSKMESQKAEHQKEGIPYLNSVMSTRELIQLIQLFGIDFDRINNEVPDSLLNSVPMSRLLSSLSGGYMEGLMKAISVVDPDNYSLDVNKAKFRGPKSCKKNIMLHYTIEQKWTACSTLDEGINLIDQSMQSKYPELFEIMACPGGCINGGGQPGNKSDKVNKPRIKEIYDQDSELSGQISQLYAEVSKVSKKLPVLELKAKED